MFSGRKKYAAIGGNQEEGFVSSFRVAARYGVDFQECLFYTDEFMWDKYKKRFGHLVILRPDPTGEYKLEVNDD